MDVKPTLNGAYIENNDDALKVVECVLGGELHSVSRRPYEIERPKLICSGNIFVFVEETSGIKRWTDGISWSPSRVVGKFLVYKELFRATAARAAVSAGISTGTGTDTDEVVNIDSSDVSGAIGTTRANGTRGSASYSYRSDGLIKKALSLRVKSSAQELSPGQDPRDPHYFTIHIISYYTLDHITRGVLVTPSELASFQKVALSQRLLDALEHTTIGNFKTMGSMSMKTKKKRRGFKPPQQQHHHSASLPVPMGLDASAPTPGQYVQNGNEQIHYVQQPLPQQLVMSHQHQHQHQHQMVMQPLPPPPPPNSLPNQTFPYYQQVYHQQGPPSHFPQHVQPVLQQPPHTYGSLYPQEMLASASAGPGVNNNDGGLAKLPLIPGNLALPSISIGQQQQQQQHQQQQQQQQQHQPFRNLPLISANQHAQTRQVQLQMQMHHATRHNSDGATTNVSPTHSAEYLPMATSKASLTNNHHYSASPRGTLAPTIGASMVQPQLPPPPPPPMTTSSSYTGPGEPGHSNMNMNTNMNMNMNWNPSLNLNSVYSRNDARNSITSQNSMSMASPSPSMPRLNPCGSTSSSSVLTASTSNSTVSNSSKSFPLGSTIDSAKAIPTALANPTNDSTTSATGASANDLTTPFKLS